MPHMSKLVANSRKCPILSGSLEKNKIQVRECAKFAKPVRNIPAEGRLVVQSAHFGFVGYSGCNQATPCRLSG